MAGGAAPAHIGCGAATGAWRRSRFVVRFHARCVSGPCTAVGTALDTSLRGPVDRASASGAEGRGFESRRRHKKVRHPSGVRDTTGTGPMRRVPTASTLSWHSKRLRVVAMAGGARHIRAGGWRPASGWTRKPAYRRVVQLAARRSLEPYVAGSNPAPPANHSRRWARSRELSVVEGSRDRSRRPPIRGWFSGRCFANTKPAPAAGHWRTG